MIDAVGRKIYIKVAKVMISIPSSEDMLKYEKMEKSGKYTKEELDKFWCEISFPNGEPYSESDVIRQCLNGNPPGIPLKKNADKKKNIDKI